MVSMVSPESPCGHAAACRYTEIIRNYLSQSTDATLTAICHSSLTLDAPAGNGSGSSPYA